MMNNSGKDGPEPTKLGDQDFEQDDGAAKSITEADRTNGAGARSTGPTVNQTGAAAESPTATPMTHDHQNQPIRMESLDIPAGLDRTTQRQLGRRLRALFDNVAEEPIPDKLLQLLDTLEQQEKQR